MPPTISETPEVSYEMTDVIPADPPIVRLRHPWRWVSGLALLLLTAMAFRSAIANDRFGWPIVGDYLFSRPIIDGFVLTLMLTSVAMVAGTVLGTVLAVMRMSANPVAKTVAWLYLWFFRGTPLLVQLIFWYNLAALYPTLSLSLPFGSELISVETNAVLTALVAAVIGLSLNESAYMAEVIRGGLLSVDAGQTMAARALGMSEFGLFRRIVLPQALRVIVPSMGNQVIGLLKHTSLVSIVALADLLYSAQLIYQQNFQTIPLLIVACCWYLLAVSVLSVIQALIERHYARGHQLGEAKANSPVKLFGLVWAWHAGRWNTVKKG